MRDSVLQLVEKLREKHTRCFDIQAPDSSQYIGCKEFDLATISADPPPEINNAIEVTFHRPPVGLSQKGVVL